MKKLKKRADICLDSIQAFSSCSCSCGCDCANYCGGSNNSSFASQSINATDHNGPYDARDYAVYMADPTHRC